MAFLSPHKQPVSYGALYILLQSTCWFILFFGCSARTLQKSLPLVLSFGLSAVSSPTDTEIADAGESKQAAHTIPHNIV